MDYIFVFGNTPELSQLELDAVFKDGDDPLKIADKLGGTVKIAKNIGHVSTEDEIPEKISEFLLSLKLPKIDFGISGIEGYSKQVKRNLEDFGIKARFVLPKEGNELSSVVVKKQKLIEIIVRPEGEGFAIGQTIWVQNFEDWNERDYGRPAVDPHAGMLPPKIARMMVNISGGRTILDPFCGVGTVLAEGLMVGASVIGSDVSKAQVERTQKNLEWLGKKPFKVFENDARNVSSKITEKVDAIVTEPDLGPNNENHLRSQAGNLREKLGYLYISALTDWQKVLKPGGKVVMVIPSFNISKDKELDLVKMVLDRAKIMGYSEFHNSIAYHRPQAIVKRNICFLTYGTH